MITEVICPRCGGRLEYSESKRYHKIRLTAEEGFKLAVQNNLTPSPEYFQQYVRSHLYGGRWKPPISVILSFLDQVAGVHCKCLRGEVEEL